MEALRDWIAPILIRALDEHLELAKPRSIHVEDELSHLCIHSDSEEFVQFVEWRSTALDITAIVADRRNSIRAAFPGASCALKAQNLTASAIPNLKPGAVLRLTCPQIRISDCFDPARVELWVGDFSVLQSGGIYQQGAQFLEISTLPDITDRLSHFMRRRVGDIMPKIETGSTADSSPGLKSQVSAEDGGDYENMGGQLLSQTDFATQVPFSPPKPLKEAPPKQRQLLGKRKISAELPQLVSDSSRALKKKMPCAQGHTLMNAESSMQTDVGRDGIESPPGEIAIKSEHPPKDLEISNTRSGLRKPSQDEAPLQDPKAAEGGSCNCQSPPRQICKIVSEVRVPSLEDHHITLAKWRDRLSKATHIPRYLQAISKAQNDLLSGDGKWQPALVGQPTRPATLPLELLNKLTAAADRKAVVCEPVPYNHQVSEILSDVSGGEADNVERPLDLLSNSPIVKTVTQAQVQNSSKGQEAESDSEGTSVEWSSSSPQSPPLRRMLPPDSSPLVAPKSISVRSPPAKGPPGPVTKSKDSLSSYPIQLPCIVDMPEASQRSRHHSNNPQASIHILRTDMETSSNLHEHSNFELPSATAEIPQADSPIFSNVRSRSVECATTAPDPTPIINSSDDCAGDKGVENDHAMHVPDTQHIPRASTSNVQQPLSHQLRESSLEVLQTQSASQGPQPSSPQLIAGTFQQGALGARPNICLQDLYEPKASVGEFELNSSEDESVHDACRPERIVNCQDEDVEISGCEQAILEIQSTLHVLPNGSGYPEGADNRTATHSNDTYLNPGIVSKGKVTTASESNSLSKRRRDETNQEKLQNNLQSAKSQIASPVLSVSSEEPDFRRVDNMTRQYRRAVYKTLRKVDIATPLPPSKLLASNASLQSESLHSSGRRRSAQTSILRQVKTSPPLTGLSIHTQPILGGHPASTSDMSTRGSLRPEDQYLVFKENYRTYRGSFSQFLISCRMIEKLRTAGKLLPQGVWDDFVHRHNHDYRSYLDHTAQSNELESPMPYEEYYVNCVSEPVYLNGILKIPFIDALSAETDPTARPNTTSLPQLSEIDQLHRYGYSIAASSSASNIHPREVLPDGLQEAPAKDDAMTLETHVHLRQQEETHQSKSSSVHLWLQKASGAASRELRTPDILAAAGNESYIDLTRNEEDMDLNFFTELQALRPDYMQTRRRDSRTSPLQEARMPDAKTEPFKCFTLGHARLDASQRRTSEIQRDANGTLRPAVQRIIDVFAWRG